MGDSTRPLLQRVYGISFPRKEMLKEWKTNQVFSIHYSSSHPSSVLKTLFSLSNKEEAAKRDHRIIARKQGLVMFHQWSPGNAFFLPHGARIYNTFVLPPC